MGVKMLYFYLCNAWRNCVKFNQTSNLLRVLFILKEFIYLLVFDCYCRLHFFTINIKKHLRPCLGVLVS